MKARWIAVAGTFTMLLALPGCGGSDASPRTVSASKEPTTAAQPEETSTPTNTATSPQPIPKPKPLTVAALHVVAGAQEWRPYSGPNPPPVSESEAASALGSGGYALGLRDMGVVRAGKKVKWFHVWVIAAETYVSDVNEGSMGGPMGSNPTPQAPRPGWKRSLTVVDATSGTQMWNWSF